MHEYIKLLTGFGMRELQWADWLRAESRYPELKMHETHDWIVDTITDELRRIDAAMAS